MTPYLETVTFLTGLQRVDNIFEGSVTVELGLKTETLLALGTKILAAFVIIDFCFAFWTHCFTFVSAFFLVGAVAILAPLNDTLGAGRCRC